MGANPLWMEYCGCTNFGSHRFSRPSIRTDSVSSLSYCAIYRDYWELSLYLAPDILGSCGFFSAHPNFSETQKVLASIELRTLVREAKRTICVIFSRTGESLSMIQIEQLPHPRRQVQVLPLYLDGCGA